MKTLLSLQIALFLCSSGIVKAQVTKFTYDSKGNMTKTALTGNTNLCKPISYVTEAELAGIVIDNDVAIQPPRSLSGGSFKAFPNPSKGEVHIQFSLEVERELFLEVFNSVGQKVLSASIGKLQTGLQSFNLSMFPPGTYLVRLIDSAGNAFTERIVLQ